MNLPFRKNEKELERQHKKARDRLKKTQKEVQRDMTTVIHSLLGSIANGRGGTS